MSKTLEEVNHKMAADIEVLYSVSVVDFVGADVFDHADFQINT